MSKERMFHNKKLKKITEVRTTIDTKHKEMSKYFQELYDTLPSLQKKLVVLQKKAKTKAKEKNKSHYFDILEEIKYLKQDIIDVSTRAEENTYTIDTHEILDEYYSSDKDKEPKKKISFNDFIKKKKSTYMTSGKEKSLYDKYMNIVTKGIYSAEQAIKTHDTYCKECNVTFIFDSTNSTHICPECGFISAIMFKPEDTESLSFRDRERAEIIKPFRYEKINHFKDWLNKVQAIENTDIPDKVYTDLKSEFEKQNIRHEDEISIKLVKSMLKKHGHDGYYNHANLILRTMANVESTVIDRTTQEQLCIMFNESVLAYEKYKSMKKYKHLYGTRKNFLNYAFALHKYCELIERDDLLEHFKFLKNRDKLYNHDQIWKIICLGDGNCYRKNRKMNAPPNYRLECVCRYDGENDHGLRWDYYPSV